MKIWKSTNLVAVATCATLLGTGFDHSNATDTDIEEERRIKVTLVVPPPTHSETLEFSLSRLEGISILLPNGELAVVAYPDLISKRRRTPDPRGAHTIEKTVDISGLSSFDVSLSFGTPYLDISWGPTIQCGVNIKPDLKAITITTDVGLTKCDIVPIY